MTHCRLLGTALLFAIAAPPIAQAQDSTISVELALALMRSALPGDEPQIFVGRAAPSVPADVIPAGSTILGSVASRFSSVLVLAMQGAVGDAIQSYESFLKERGWRPIERGPEMGGFLPTDAMPSRPLMLCRDSLFTIAVGAPAGQRTHLRVQVNHTMGAPGCGARGERGERPTRQSEVIPPLRAPPGAVVNPTGGGGGTDSWHASAVVRSELDTGQLLTHYTGELRAAGWSVDAPVKSGALTVAQTRRTDTEGVAWVGVLSILELATTGVRDVTVRVRRADSTPWNH